jgi:cell division protein FtsB
MDDATGPDGAPDAGAGAEEPTGAQAGEQQTGQPESGEQQDATGPKSAQFSRQGPGGDAGALRRPAPEGEPASRDDTPPFGRRRRGRFAVGAVAVLVVGALVAALFVLPVRAWLGQRRALAEAEEQLDVIWKENKRLEDVYDELQTDEVIEQQAREQFGLIKPGEQALSVLPAPAATALPSGWPYDQVQAILWIRIAAEAESG